MTKQEPIRCARRKVRRNEPCPFCTSGRKFKRCHGAPVEQDVPRGTHVAGKDGEQPAFMIYTARKALGPMVYA